MTDLAALTARAEAWNDNNTPWRSVSDAEALIRDLLTYATTVSRERDGMNEFPDTLTWSCIHRLRARIQALESALATAEQERDAAIASAKAAAEQLRQRPEAPTGGAWTY